MMNKNLNDLFIDRGYKNMADNITEFSDSFFLDYFFDENEDKMPKELLGIYISSHRDELFFVINGTGEDLKRLCDRWDEKIRTFMIFGSREKEILSKLKYNVVQIVLCENEVKDRSLEGSLNISRKIILSFEYGEKGQVEIDDEAVLELPFVMIESGELAKQEETVMLLQSLLPKEGMVGNCLRTPRIRAKRIKGQDGKTNKSFENEFEQIREWLTGNDNTGNKN